MKEKTKDLLGWLLLVFFVSSAVFFVLRVLQVM